MVNAIVPYRKWPVKKFGTKKLNYFVFLQIKKLYLQFCPPLYTLNVTCLQCCTTNNHNNKCILSTFVKHTLYYRFPAFPSSQPSCSKYGIKQSCSLLALPLCVHFSHTKYAQLFTTHPINKQSIVSECVCKYVSPSLFVCLSLSLAV